MIPAKVPDNVMFVLLNPPQTIYLRCILESPFIYP